MEGGQDRLGHGCDKRLEFVGRYRPASGKIASGSRADQQTIVGERPGQLFRSRL